MTWNEFTVFAIVSAAFWIAGAVIAFRRESYSRLAAGLTGVGLCFYTVFIIALWITLQRPPLKTMGETRLWYSFGIAYLSEVALPMAHVVLDRHIAGICHHQYIETRNT